LASGPWKAWYKTKRWRDLKQEVHVRDAYTCQRSGVICSGHYPAHDSPVANHKQPHRGNAKLFWDPDNIETVSKAIHDSLIQTEEQISRHTIGVWD
jgi:5-methylcytosine-specific restriction endonuclease McrA